MESTHTFTIGGKPNCDIVLTDRSVSRLHATLSFSNDGRWLLRDQSSSGTCFVDRDVSLNGRSACVSSADVLQFGESIVTVQALVEEIRRKFPELFNHREEKSGRAKVYGPLANPVCGGIIGFSVVLAIVFTVLCSEKVREFLTAPVWIGIGSVAAIIGAIAAVLAVIFMLRGFEPKPH
ncbi:MAG: FHA domain-containing protein [Candidatus Kentron sp. G]|nr:MAG: FHA domain-containing protein [Candidatus Kentron sp. G]